MQDSLDRKIANSNKEAKRRNQNLTQVHQLQISASTRIKFRIISDVRTRNKNYNFLAQRVKRYLYGRKERL
jgi:hypothetical protein